MTQLSDMFQQALAAERPRTTPASIREAVAVRATRASATRRTIRLAVSAVAAVVGIAVLGGGSWLLADHIHEPASPVPSATPTASASPTPSASTTPSPAPVATVSIAPVDGEVARLAPIEFVDTNGSPAYPSVQPATPGVLASVTDYWSLVTIQGNQALDPTTGLPTLPIGVYLVSPKGTYYEVMKMPATYGSNYKLVDWDPRTGYAMMRLGSGAEVVILDLVAPNRFSAQIPASIRLGVASDNRTYWIFTDNGGSYSVAAWSPLISQQWSIVDFAGATMFPLHFDDTTGTYSPTVTLPDHGDWVAYATDDPARGPLEALNVTTGKWVHFAGPGGDSNCTPGPWRTTTTLVLDCPDTEPGAFTVEAPAFANPVPFTGYATPAEELWATGSARIPASSLVLGGRTGSDVVTSVSLATTDGLKELATFDAADGYGVETVLQPRTGVYVLTRGDERTGEGPTLVVDTTTGTVAAYPAPPVAVQTGAHWSQLVYMAPTK